jgi:hypothetical protein
MFNSLNAANMNKSVYILLSHLTILLLLVIPTFESGAIPAFARKYQISCQVCHSPAAPRLKAFGEDFAGNGFRMSDFEAPRYFINTGDEKLSLLKELPVAIRFDGHIVYTGKEDKAAVFGFPFGLKLLSGGEISKKLSYYFYFYMDEAGKQAGVEDAFLTYSDLFGTGINITAGQFQVCDPLYKRELRLTLEDYKIYTVKPGNSKISLKYDRGIVVDYGLPTGTEFVAQVVNGNGIGEAGDEFLFDTDKYKNYFLKVSQSIGKMVDIGFFGYFGKEELSDEPSPPVNSAVLYGPNLTFDLNEKLVVNLQYLRRTDSKVLIPDERDLVEEDALTHGGFAEVIFSPKGDRSNWYLTLLGNWIDSDINELDYSSATVHAGYLLRRNIRLVGEYTRQFAGEEYGRASLGFIAAF